MSSGYGIAAAVGATAAAGISAAAARRQSKKQRNFIRELRSTAFQVQREDLEKAGINPLLAFGGGGGSGGAAVVPGQLPNLGDFGGQAIGEGISTAFEVKEAKADIANTEAQTQTETTKQEANKAQAAQARSNSALNLVHGDIAELERIGANAELSGRVNAAKTQAGIERSPFGKATRWIKRGINTLPGGMLRNLTPGPKGKGKRR